MHTKLLVFCPLLAFLLCMYICVRVIDVIILLYLLLPTNVKIEKLNKLYLN